MASYDYIQNLLRLLAQGKIQITDPDEIAGLGQKLAKLSQSDASAIASGITPEEFQALRPTPFGEFTGWIENPLGMDQYNSNSERSNALKAFYNRIGFEDQMAPLVSQTLPDGTPFPENYSQMWDDYGTRRFLTPEETAVGKALKAQIDADATYNAQRRSKGLDAIMGRAEGLVPDAIPQVPQSPIAGIPVESSPELIQELAESVHPVLNPIGELDPGGYSDYWDTYTTPKPRVTDFDPGGYSDYWDNYIAPKPIVRDLDPGGYSDYWDSYTTPKAPTVETPVTVPTSGAAPVATPPTSPTSPTSTPSVSRASIVTGGATPKRTRTPMEMSPSEHALLDKLRKTSNVEGSFDIGQGEEARRQSWVDPAQVKKRAPGVSAASAAHPNATLGFGARGATVDPKKYIGGVADGIDDILGGTTDPNRFSAGTLGMSDVHPDIASAATPREGLPGLFDRIFGAPSQKATATSRAGSGDKGFGRLFAPELSGNLKGIGDTLGNPQFNYTAGTGLKGWGKNLGGWYTGIKGGADAIGILNNLSDSAKEKTNTQDLQSDILTAAMSNPMSTYSLTSDQLKLLGDIRAGRREEGADFSDFDMGAGLKGAVTGALTGLPGGLTGAILGGLGGFAKEGTAGLAAGQQRRNAELEALYQTLNASNVDYKNAMRQRMMQRYF